MSKLSTHSSIGMKATGIVAKAKRDKKKIPLDWNHPWTMKNAPKANSRTN